MGPTSYAKRHLGSSSEREKAVAIQSRRTSEVQARKKGRARSRDRAEEIVGSVVSFERVGDALNIEVENPGILERLRESSKSRVFRWHGKRGVKDWNVMEWSAAAAGEMGEACNVAKKIKRLDTGLQRRKSESKRKELVAKLADEIADTIIYLDLLAMREGIDVSSAIVSKFNRTSEEFGFPERL